VFVVWIGLAPATFLAPAAPAVRAATRAAEEKFAVRMQADAARTTVARVESP
jgi:hypothetical protein